MKINIKKQSGIYTLTSEQILPISLEKAWRDREKNTKEGIFKEAYIEIYKIMHESILIL